MELMIFIVVGGLASIVEVPRLIKDKLFKDLLIFLFLLGVSLGIAVMEASEFPLPSPAKLIEAMVGMFIKVKFGYQP